MCIAADARLTLSCFGRCQKNTNTDTFLVWADLCCCGDFLSLSLPLPPSVFIFISLFANSGWNNPNKMWPKIYSFQLVVKIVVPCSAIKKKKDWNYPRLKRKKLICVMPCFTHSSLKKNFGWNIQKWIKKWVKVRKNILEVKKKYSNFFFFMKMKVAQNCLSWQLDRQPTSQSDKWSRSLQLQGATEKWGGGFAFAPRNGDLSLTRNYFQNHSQVGFQGVFGEGESQNQNPQGRIEPNWWKS